MPPGKRLRRRRRWRLDAHDGGRFGSRGACEGRHLGFTPQARRLEARLPPCHGDGLRAGAPLALRVGASNCERGAECDQARGSRAKRHRGQPLGHAALLIAPGRRQPSVRLGTRSPRISKRVYFPISLPRRTNTSRTTPARNQRSRVVNRTRARPAIFSTRLTGQPRPLQRTSTRARAGARTDRIRTFTPRDVTLPASRTTGNGLSSLGGGLDWGVDGVSEVVAGGTRTVNVRDTVEDAPVLSLTRRVTCLLPAVENL